jgi:hypothetical protein
MMRVMSCSRVREDLTAYHDEELPVDQQVLIQSHLNECVACRLEAVALDDVRDALRTAAASLSMHLPSQAGRLTGPVLERVRVERQLSFATQIRSLFDDMHFVWAGLGATVAMAFCIFASAGVLQAASTERPDSLAGIISQLANPGSNANPVRLDGYMLAPRPLLDPTLPVVTGDSEVTFSAVVTREGTIQNLELLEEALAHQASPEILLAMRDAASRARFAPAQERGGAPVAVSMVWVLSTTTVKGVPDYDLYLVRPPRWSSQSVGPVVAPKARPVEVPVKTLPSTDLAAD